MVMSTTPQFPLGTVLFPSMVLPLHVFEPRYQTMVEEVTRGDGMFGVVLIERGSEVGGDDQRTDVGTMAKIVEAERLDDGRWALITVGLERFRVEEWLPDDPYPRAEIRPWPDQTEDGEGDDLTEPYRRVVGVFRRCFALAAEAGLDVGPLPETVDDAELGCMQMSAMAPVTTHDKQRLLAAPTTRQRIELLDTMLADALELIQVRLTED